MSGDDFDLSRLHLEAARQALEEARLLLARELWRGTGNRIYYACFYAVIALIGVDGKKSPKHTGVRAIFMKDYVHTGEFTKEQGRLHNTLMDSRLETDYVIKQVLPVERLPEWLMQAEAFVEDVDRAVEKRKSISTG